MKWFRFIKQSVKKFFNLPWVKKFIQGFKNVWYYYRLGKTLVFIFLLGMVLTSAYMTVIAKTTDVGLLQDSLMTRTKIYDKHEEVSGELSAQKGHYVGLDAIAEPMKQTVVAVEDRRFYQHNGIDPMGMARAAVRLLINRDTTGGGGSTITQQLVKNGLLSADQTVQRKLKELFLALEVEKHYAKDDILEMYLNRAYFGNGVWGIEDASMKYFGHSADSLDWSEASILTGMLRAPEHYNPIDHYQKAIDIRSTVLELLGNQEILDAPTIHSLENSDIYLEDAYVSAEASGYPSYFDAVINEANELTKIPEEDLLTKGYHIYTHLDQAYQQQLDASYDQDWIFPDGNQEAEPIVQSASAVVNPENGGIMAVYGGRGDYVYRGFNRATSMRRSPGSTIKPLAVYVPALEKGYRIHSSVPDVVKAYGKDKYQPENYDLQTDPSGEVELYYALAQSKNTSAVYLMDEIGIQVAVNKLKQFGIDVPSQDQQLTLALGAFSSGLSPVQLANAYAAFANQGIRNDSYFIRRIEDAQGKVVYSKEKPAKHMVMTPNVAADMTSMMLDTFGGYGTSYGAGPDYGQIAGKSGSTEEAEGSTQTRDRWLVGFTPDFVLVTWVGLDEMGSESLDDLMPAGLSSLFNYQSTALMNVSPQTPFSVLAASSMAEDSNHIEDRIWQDSLTETAEYWWEQIQMGGGELWETIVDKSADISEGVYRFIEEKLPN